MRDWQDLRTELGDEALDGDGGKLDGDTTEASRQLVAGDGRAASLEEMAGRMAATVCGAPPGTGHRRR